MVRDIVGLRDESLPGEGQLVTVFENGERVAELSDLGENPDQEPPDVFWDSLPDD